MRILSYLPLNSLLQSVNRVNKRLNSIVQLNQYLWRNFDFDYPISISHKVLSFVLSERKSHTLQTFSIPDSEHNLTAAQLDSHLVHLGAAKQLKWLDLSSQPLSTLCFLQNFRALEVLILDCCTNIIDCDIHVLKQCSEIRHLYIGFCKVSAATIIESVPHKIETLDCSGILFSCDEAYDLMRVHCDHLQFFTFSMSNLTREIHDSLCNAFENITIKILSA